MPADSQTIVIGIRVVLLASWPALPPTLSCKAVRAAGQSSEAAN